MRLNFEELGWALKVGPDLVRWAWPEKLGLALISWAGLGLHNWTGPKYLGPNPMDLTKMGPRWNLS